MNLLVYLLHRKFIEPDILGSKNSDDFS